MHILIRDTGTGIPEEILPKIFGWEVVAESERYDENDACWGKQKNKLGAARYFRHFIEQAHVKALFDEIEEVVKRHNEQHRIAGEREGFDRMIGMQSIEFSRKSIHPSLVR